MPGEKPSKPPLFPIRAAARLTGINIDTLRAWERRYEAVVPRRDGRGRMYSESDIQRLQLLHAAVESGHAIGRIAGLTDAQLKELLETAYRASTATLPGAQARAPGIQVDLGPFWSSILRFDYPQADRELGRLALMLPPRDFVRAVALPLMQRVGEEWKRGDLTVAQEHLISVLVRNLIGSLVRLTAGASVPGQVLSTTPSGEGHEFGVLCASLLAAGGGLGVTYLGPNLPAEEILEAARRTAAQVVLLGVVGTGGVKPAIRNVKTISAGMPPHTELWVGGAGSRELEAEIRKTSALYLQDFDELEEHLQRLSARF